MGRDPECTQLKIFALSSTVEFILYTYTMPTCQRINLPDIPNNIKEYLVQLAESIVVSEEKRQWVQRFQGNLYTVAFQEYGTENTQIDSTVKEQLDQIFCRFFPDENIWYTLGKIQGLPDQVSLIPPHCDRGRHTACNYLLSTGGEHVRTVFYNRIRDKENLDSAVNILKSQVVEESSIVMDLNQWYIFNAQQAHGVENLTGTRLIFSIVFPNNLTFSEFVQKYQHMVAVA